MSWYFYNALLYIPRYTFLPFITPTPLLNFFYQMMGMKIGKNTIINTFNISDACMITLGDRVVIGGSATIFAHYGQKGYLVIAPVVIEDEVNIGLKASIMGDDHIGKGAFISAHSVVYPKSRIAPQEKFSSFS
jgi:acetyltransferase-like isoleucine patch superfamily enzyme